MKPTDQIHVAATVHRDAVGHLCGVGGAPTQRDSPAQLAGTAHTDFAVGAFCSTSTTVVVASFEVSASAGAIGLSSGAGTRARVADFSTCTGLTTFATVGVAGLKIQTGRATAAQARLASLTATATVVGAFVDIHALTRAVGLLILTSGGTSSADASLSLLASLTTFATVGCAGAGIHAFVTAQGCSIRAEEFALPGLTSLTCFASVVTGSTMQHVGLCIHTDCSTGLLPVGARQNALAVFAHLILTTFAKASTAVVAVSLYIMTSGAAQALFGCTFINANPLTCRSFQSHM